MKVYAPWTDDQVASLNAYQREAPFHSFTCGSCGAGLHAFPSGWRCPTPACTYTQDWAHDFMADWSWKRAADFSPSDGQQ